MDSVKIAVVGLGRLGKRHAETLARKVPGAALVAAASPLAEERAWAEQQLDVVTYDSIERLLGHPGVDAVWLVTPTALHAEQVTAALGAGKHVFCEKPLALDVAACDRVLAVAAAQPALVAMVGFMRRFDPGYIAARRALSDGELGNVFRIHCESHDPVDPTGFFVRFAPTSGGIFLDCCIHDVDLVRWMLEGARPLAVSAHGSRVMYPALAACGDVDTAVATVEFEGGALASFHVSRTSFRGYEASMSLTGTRGGLTVGRDLASVPVVRESAGGRQVQGLPDFFARFDQAFLNEARAFVDAVRVGKPSPLTLHDAREATALACAMREALATGTRIAL